MDEKKDQNQESNDPQEEQKEEEQYSFLQETIKKDTLASKKGVRKSIRIICGRLLFGFCACLGFFALKPWAQNMFQGNPDAVTIPADEDVQGDSEDVLLEDEAAQVLDGASYQQLLEKVDAVASSASKSVVAVQSSAVNADAEITDEEAETEAVKSEAGLIVADNGQELLILTASSVISENADLTVKFSNNATYAAALKKQDKNLGLAIISISRNEISGDTWGAIAVASLGNSRVVYQGDLTIALGNTYGYAGGQGYGIISSTEYKAELSDGNCGILATDIATTEKGTGILFNLEGEVIGIIMPGIWENESGLLANAYAISDLKTAIELLSNGAGVPYVGIHGTYITEELSQEQSIPQGIYVNQVDTDSPAMAAGIQSGDVILKVGATDITSLEAYERAVIGKTVGGNVKVKAQRRGNNGYVDIDFNVKIGSLE